MMDYVKWRPRGEEDLSVISPWTAKNFTCSFCNREFRSAQALGGHMNVHRRDRARLRLLPPNSILCSSEYSPYPNPNPNPNPNSYLAPSPSSSSFSGASKYLPHLPAPGSTYEFTPSTGTGSDHKNKKLMVIDSGSQKQNVPALLNSKKGVKRGSGLGDEYGDQLKGFPGFADFAGKHHLDDNFEVVKKDKKQINMTGVDLELRLGHL